MILVTPNIDAIEPLGPAELPERPADQTLEARFARGDAAAFDEVVEVYRTRVTRLAYRLLGWRGEVDDIVQEVFLAALKHLGRYRGQASLNTWLSTITVNACRSHRRWRLVRWRFFERTKNDSSPTEMPADHDAIDGETFTKVREAVQKLPAADREMIVLHYLEQVPADEMAAMLKIRRNAVEVRLHRARKKLKAMLGGLVEENS